MQIIPAFVTQNPLYQQYTRIQVRKLVLHSVGCPQPSAADFPRFTRAQLTDAKAYFTTLNHMLRLSPRPGNAQDDA